MIKLKDKTYRNIYLTTLTNDFVTPELICQSIMQAKYPCVRISYAKKKLENNCDPFKSLWREKKIKSKSFTEHFFLTQR